MSIELKVPEVGESIKEVLIGEWLKSEGDHVERDEEVVVLETDKATVEVPAPESGTLTKVLKQSGDKAAVGDVIAYLEAGETQGQQDSSKKVKSKTPAAPSQDRTEKVAERKGTAEALVKEGEERDGEAKRETDAKRDAVRSKSFDTETEETEMEVREEKEKRVARKASGEPDNARVKKAEAGRGEEAPKEVQPRHVKAFRSADGEITERDDGKLDEVETKPSISNKEARAERVMPMTPIRKRIAEHLVKAQQTTAFLTTFNEVDMSAVKSLREEYRESFRVKHQIKLGFMSFFVKATVEALKFVPQVNAQIRGTDLVFHDYCDIGVAVGGGKGLVVPVLRNAERMSFASIEKSIADFARRAETNRLKPEDLEGGTFTISNGGIYGSLLSTPILNFPQSGILGLHAIQDRPVVRNGEVVVRPMMYVALTYDHRVVDGREAVTFLKRIKECIEAPSRMLLEV